MSFACWITKWLKNFYKYDTAFTFFICVDYLYNARLLIFVGKCPRICYNFENSVFIDSKLVTIGPLTCHSFYILCTISNLILLLRMTSGRTTFTVYAKRMKRPTLYHSINTENVRREVFCTIKAIMRAATHATCQQNVGIPCFWVYESTVISYNDELNRANGDAYFKLTKLSLGM